MPMKKPRQCNKKPMQLMKKLVVQEKDQTPYEKACVSYQNILTTQEKLRHPKKVPWHLKKNLSNLGKSPSSLKPKQGRICISSLKKAFVAYFKAQSIYARAHEPGLSDPTLKNTLPTLVLQFFAHQVA